MGDIVPITNIIPKTLRRIYKRCHYVITFIPKDKRWKWTVEVVRKTQHSDIADSMVKAQKAAERCIDKFSD